AARARLRGAARGGHRSGQLRVAMLFFEVAYRLRHARAAEGEELVYPLDLGKPLIEAAPRDDQLAHEVHQRVEAIEADADAGARFGARAHGRRIRAGRHEAGRPGGGDGRGGGGGRRGGAASWRGPGAGGLNASRRSGVCWSRPRASGTGAPSSARSVSAPSVTASTMAGLSSSR